MIENYPGFPKGITGRHIISLLDKHLDASGVKARFEKVIFLDYCAGEFIVKTEQSQRSFSRLILASGTVPNVCEIPGVDDPGKERVFYEITELNTITGKRIAIIGGGDAAFDYALNLASGNLITIFHRSHRSSCLPLLRERSEKNAKISFKPDYRLIESQLIRDKIQLGFETPNGLVSEQFDYLLIAIGRRPNLTFVSNNLLNQLEQLEGKGLLFKIGDLKNGHCRQMGIAVGDGIKAAMTLAYQIESSSK